MGEASALALLFVVSGVLYTVGMMIYGIAKLIYTAAPVLCLGVIALVGIIIAERATR